MGICPKCGESIDFLVVKTTEENIYNYSAGGTMQFRESISQCTDYYKCPRCHERLEFDYQDEADAFLGDN